MDDALYTTSPTEFGELWIRRIIELMSENLKADMTTMTTARFTTSTALTQTCNRLCTMKAMSNYFVYVCATRCGLPMVSLEGEEEDWKQLVTKTNALRQFCADAGMDLEWYFEDIQKPLENLLSTYQHADCISPELAQWWQTIINRKNPQGSGQVTYNGWITQFIAYTSDNRKRRSSLSANCFTCSYVKGDFVRRHNGSDSSHVYVGGLVGVEYIENEVNIVTN
jgi:hypothetical protein